MYNIIFHSHFLVFCVFLTAWCMCCLLA